jgi:hypothetical protein
MCKQRLVVQKIVEKNEVNGFGVELAEAQMEDYIVMNRKVSNIEKVVSSMKKEQKRQGEMLARQGGQIDLLVQRINSPVEEERINGVVWTEIKKFLNTSFGKTIIILLIFCLGLTGQRILELTGLVSI